MIHATYIWMLMLPIENVFIDYNNRLYAKMGAFTLFMEFE